MIEKPFGWWPRNSSIEAIDLNVQPLPTFATAVQSVKDDPRNYNGWYYPPLAPVRASGTEAKEPPTMPSPIFALPPTHLAIGQGVWMDEEYLHFVITLAGFLDGMRLVPNGWVHFYKAPTKTNRLADIVCSGKEIGEVITKATEWWQSRDVSERRAMFGAVHGFCFSGLYHHEFEEFAARYVVLDTLDWLHRSETGEKRGRHAERPSALASAYGLDTPAWAAVENGRCRLADIRNQLIHEGRLAGEPIGFAHLPESQLTLELGAFLSRLIIGILGVQCSYVASPCNTRSMHGLGLC